MYYFSKMTQAWEKKEGVPFSLEIMKMEISFPRLKKIKISLFYELYATRYFSSLLNGKGTKSNTLGTGHKGKEGLDRKNGISEDTFFVAHPS